MRYSLPIVLGAVAAAVGVAQEQQQQDKKRQLLRSKRDLFVNRPFRPDNGEDSGTIPGQSPACLICPSGESVVNTAEDVTFPGIGSDNTISCLQLLALGQIGGIAEEDCTPENVAAAVAVCECSGGGSGTGTPAPVTPAPIAPTTPAPTDAPSESPTMTSTVFSNKLVYNFGETVEIEYFVGTEDWEKDDWVGLYRKGYDDELANWNRFDGILSNWFHYLYVCNGQWPCEDTPDERSGMVYFNSTTFPDHWPLPVGVYEVKLNRNQDPPFEELTANTVQFSIVYPNSNSDVTVQKNVYQYGESVRVNFNLRNQKPARTTDAIDLFNRGHFNEIDDYYTYLLTCGQEDIEDCIRPPQNVSHVVFSEQTVPDHWPLPPGRYEVFLTRGEGTTEDPYVNLAYDSAWFDVVGFNPTAMVEPVDDKFDYGEGIEIAFDSGGGRTHANDWIAVYRMEEFMENKMRNDEHYFTQLTICDQRWPCDPLDPDDPNDAFPTSGSVTFEENNDGYDFPLPPGEYVVFFQRGDRLPYLSLPGPGEFKTFEVRDFTRSAQLLATKGVYQYGETIQVFFNYDTRLVPQTNDWIGIYDFDEDYLGAEETYVYNCGLPNDECTSATSTGMVFFNGTSIPEDWPLAIGRYKINLARGQQEPFVHLQGNEISFRIIAATTITTGAP